MSEPSLNFQNDGNEIEKLGCAVPRRKRQVIGVVELLLVEEGQEMVLLQAVRVELVLQLSSLAFVFL